MIRRKFGEAKAKNIFAPQAHIHSTVKVAKRSGQAYRTSFPANPRKRALTLCQCPFCHKEIPSSLKPMAIFLHSNKGRCLSPMEMRDYDD